MKRPGEVELRGGNEGRDVRVKFGSDKRKDDERKERDRWDEVTEMTNGGGGERRRLRRSSLLSRKRRSRKVKSRREYLWETMGRGPERRH